MDYLENPSEKIHKGTMVMEKMIHPSVEKRTPSMSKTCCTAWLLFEKHMMQEGHKRQANDQEGTQSGEELALVAELRK